MKRENIVGRANVEDTPELEAYYRERTRYRHGAHEESVRFSFNNFPAMRALGLYREEALP
jgi:hypothetical protein